MHEIHRYQLALFDRGQRLGLLEDLGPLLAGKVGDLGIEVAAPDHSAPVGVLGVLGPGHFHEESSPA